MAKQEDQQTYILQSATLGGEDFDLSMMTECAYIETFDLSGPKLIMKFHDRLAYIRDELGVKERDEIEIELADPFHQEGIDEKQTFRILTMPTKEGVLTINAMQADVEAAKIPCEADGGKSFVETPASKVIQSLLPGASVDSSASSSSQYYYLAEGEKPSKLLRAIAKEQGCVLFWNRGTVYFKPLSDFNQGEFEYAYDDPTHENQIHDYKNLTIKSVLDHKTQISYRSFDIVRGRIKSTMEKDASGRVLPVQLSGITDESVLANMTKLPVPVIDFVTLGNGHLKPGIPINLKWNVPKKDAPLDESLPDRIITGAVTHWYSAQKYYCRIRGIQWPE